MGLRDLGASQREVREGGKDVRGKEKKERKINVSVREEEERERKTEREKESKREEAVVGKEAGSTCRRRPKRRREEEDVTAVVLRHASGGVCKAWRDTYTAHRAHAQIWKGA